MHPSRLRQRLAILFWLGLTCATAAPVEHVPLDLIFRPPQGETVALSPDGRHVAFDFLQQGVRFLGVHNRESGSNRYFRLSGEEKGSDEPNLPARVSHLVGLRWISNERLVVNVDQELVVAINADGSKPQNLGRRRPIEGNFNFEEMRDQLSGIDQATESGDLDAILAAQERQLEMDDFLDEVLWDSSSSATGSSAPGDWFFKRRGAHFGYPQVLDWLEDDPDHVLIALTPLGGYAVHDLNHDTILPGQQERLMRRMTRNQGGGFEQGFPEFDRAVLADDTAFKPPLIFELYKVNVHSGKEQRIHLPPQNATRWLTDRAGELRIVLEHHQTNRKLLYRQPGSNRWRPLDDVLEKAGLAPTAFSPTEYLGRRSRVLGFGYDPNLLYVASYGEGDTLAVYELNLETGAAEELARHLGYDLADPLAVIDETSLLFDRAERKLVGIRFVDTGVSTQWLDPRFRGVQGSLDQAVPGHRNVILDWNATADVFIVRSESPQNPGEFLVLDSAKGRLSQLLPTSPWLREQPLTSTAAFQIPGENGRLIHGLITLPAKVEAPTVPFVVFPHDGPWKRDQLGFDRNVQALASMGFAVIQVNFPGSTGYGYKHLHALTGAYSEAPLQDLERVHRWFVEGGVGDPKKSAIVGFGYGGYLALRAVSRPSPVYRCAVGISAPVSLPAHLNRIENPFLQAFTQAMVGASADLHTGSTQQVLDEIPVPLLLVQGRSTLSATALPAINLRMFSNLPERETLRVESDEYGDWYAETQVRVFRAIGAFLDDVFNRREPKVEIGPIQVIDWDADEGRPRREDSAR